MEGLEKEEIFINKPGLKEILSLYKK
jgi:hypothetical protein